MNASPFDQLLGPVTLPVNLMATQRQRVASYNMGTSGEVLAYCNEPRTMDEIVDELGDSAQFTVWNLVKHKKLVNLKGPRQKGLYVVAERAAEFAHLAAPAPKARIKIGRATAHETVVWHRMAGRNHLPESCKTVLLAVAGQPEVFDAWHDADGWHWAADGRPVEGRVIAWAEKPAGPKE
jgi:hypothetical protein